jgi:hypothetical protein
MALLAQVKFTSDYPASCSKDTTEKKLKIPDVKDFPNEANMTALQWTQALPNYKCFLRQVADDAVYKNFKKHFDALQSELNFESNFPAMLAMDILFCSKFYKSMVKFNRVQWDKDLAQCRAMQIRKDLSQVNSSSSAYRQDSRPNCRFTPYPQPRPSPASASYHGPSLFKTNPTPIPLAPRDLPSASSVNEGTLTKNALKQIRRKANRALRQLKEDPSFSEVVTVEPYALASTSVADVHSGAIGPTTPLTYVHSAAVSRTTHVARASNALPLNPPEGVSSADDNLSIITHSLTSSLSFNSLSSSAPQKLLSATDSDSLHAFSSMSSYHNSSSHSNNSCSHQTRTLSHSQSHFIQIKVSFNHRINQLFVKIILLLASFIFLVHFSRFRIRLQPTSVHLSTSSSLIHP